MKIKKNVVISAAVLSLSVLFTGCGEKSLNPEDYCSVVVSGADGYAHVRIVDNSSALESQLAEGVGDDDWKKLFSAAMVASEVRYEIVSDKTEKLSNGDVIEVKVNFDKEEMKELGYKFSKDSFKYKVKDLKEAIPLDPFEYIEISFSGLSGKGSALVTTGSLSAMGIYNVNFHYDKENHLSNGDNIDVKVEINENELLESGYALAVDSHTYTVSGLAEARSIDPFEGLVLEYSDVSPNARVSFNTSACEDFVRNYVYFNASNSTYANGDIVEVTVSYDESRAEENGIVLSRDKNTYTCEGADFYPSRMSDADFSEVDSALTDEIISAMAKDNYYKGGIVHGRSMFTDINGSDEYTVESVEIKPAKKIYMYTKNPSSAYTMNKYAVVFDIEVTAEKTKIDGKENDSLAIGDKASIHYYATNYVSNISADKDGKCKTISTNDTKYKLYYMSYWGANPGWLDFRDPVNLNTTADSLAEQFRSENLGDFTVEVNDQ